MVSTAGLDDLQVLFLDLAPLVFVTSQLDYLVPVLYVWRELLPLFKAACLAIERQLVAEYTGFDLQFAQFGISFRPSDWSRHEDCIQET